MESAARRAPTDSGGCSEKPRREIGVYAEHTNPTRQRGECRRNPRWRVGLVSVAAPQRWNPLAHPGARVRLMIRSIPTKITEKALNRRPLVFSTKKTTIMAASCMALRV